MTLIRRDRKTLVVVRHVCLVKSVCMDMISDRTCEKDMGDDGQGSNGIIDPKNGADLSVAVLSLSRWNGCGRAPHDDKNTTTGKAVKRTPRTLSSTSLPSPLLLSGGPQASWTGNAPLLPPLRELRWGHHWRGHVLPHPLLVVYAGCGYIQAPRNLPPDYRRRPCVHKQQPQQQHSSIAEGQRAVEDSYNRRAPVGAGYLLRCKESANKMQRSRGREVSTGKDGLTLPWQSCAVDHEVGEDLACCESDKRPAEPRVTAPSHDACKTSNSRSPFPIPFA